MKWTISVLALTVFVVIAFVVLHRTRQRPTENASPPVTAKDEILAVDFGSHPVHLSVAAITKLASTATGREILCSQIGIEGAGLDTASYIAAEQALFDQKEVTDSCLEAVLNWLNGWLTRKRLGSLSSMKNDSMKNDDWDVTLLRKYPDAVARIIHQDYGLGTANPPSDLIPLLLELRLPTVCPDLRITVLELRSNKDLMASDFQAAQRKLCI